MGFGIPKPFFKGVYRLNFGLSLLITILTVILAFGIPIFIIVKRAKKIEARNKRCTYRVNAVCVNRYTEKKEVGEGTEILYYTVWAFIDDGYNYQTTLRVTESTFSEIGEYSTLLVNPYNPNEAIKEISYQDKLRKKKIRKRIIKISIIFVIITFVLGWLDYMGYCPWLFAILDILG